MRRRILLTTKGFRYEFVDLGSTIPVLWCKQNVGASGETDYGNYYQWGSGDNVFVSTGTSNYHTQGSATSYTLPNTADTVSVVIGNDCRMPTKDDFKTLTANTSIDSTSINGVYGKKFTNKTDSSKYIFIPYGGIYTGNSISQRNTRFCMWTANATSSTSNAIIFSGTSSQNGFIGKPRRNGLTIRGIRDKNYVFSAATTTYNLSEDSQTICLNNVVSTVEGNSAEYTVSSYNGNVSTTSTSQNGYCVILKENSSTTSIALSTVVLKQNGSNKQLNFYFYQSVQKWLLAIPEISGSSTSRIYLPQSGCTKSIAVVSKYNGSNYPFTVRNEATNLITASINGQNISLTGKTINSGTTDITGQNLYVAQNRNGTNYSVPIRYSLYSLTPSTPSGQNDFRLSSQGYGTFSSAFVAGYSLCIDTFHCETNYVIVYSYTTPAITGVDLSVESNGRIKYIINFTENTSGADRELYVTFKFTISNNTYIVHLTQPG